MRVHVIRRAKSLTYAVAIIFFLSWLCNVANYRTLRQDHTTAVTDSQRRPKRLHLAEVFPVQKPIESDQSLTGDDSKKTILPAAQDAAVKEKKPPVHIVETGNIKGLDSNNKIIAPASKDVQAAGRKVIKENPSVAKFYLMVMLSISNGRRFPGYEQFTVEDMRGRDQEYLSTLEHNINHESVKEVHLFYRDVDSLKVVEAKNYTNRGKIVPVKKERGVHMSDFFLYASRYLLDKPVIALNGDIMLGKNFDKINTMRMRDEKVLYSLSRYNLIEEGKPCQPQNMQLPPGYMISHDTHIFRLAEPLNETLILDKLDYPINMWGAENAMIWTFKYTLKWTVRNPCKVLPTYHNHCTKVHGPSLKESKKTKYSILYLPNKNWTDTSIRESIVRYENRLLYGAAK